MVLPKIQFCLFSSTPDIEKFGFIVKVLTGTPEELCESAVRWGYDGVEFLPDPLNLPDPARFERAIQQTGAIVPVINSGRFACQNMPLLVEDKQARQKSVEAFKRLIEFAGQLKARVGLGIARGAGLGASHQDEMDHIAAEVFAELTECAVQNQTTIMLEAAEPEVTSYINTMDSVMQWVYRIGSPGFSAMLDTHQLSHAEPSIEHGIRVSRGEAVHIHLYDPSRWPPGVRQEACQLDWSHIAKVMREQQFSGTASLVLAPEGDAEVAARTALAFLKDVLSENKSLLNGISGPHSTLDSRSPVKSKDVSA